MKKAALCLLPILGFAFLLASAPAPGRFSSYDPQVNELLARMTLDEKIGQMTQADHTGLRDPTDIETYFLGSVLNGGDSDPKDGNSLQAWTAMVKEYQQHALRTRLKIPLLYGVDAVHGHNNVEGAVIFPHNIGLGATHNPALVERAERITAEEVRATGINWAFAPCVTVPQDPRWGRTYEGFSDSPDVVKAMAGPAVHGFQGDDLAAPTSVVACAKHFVGDGGTTWGSAGRGGRGIDQGDTRVDEATLRRVHLQGYIAAIQAGVGTIMPSYSSWNGVKVSGSKELMTDLLKGELGFEGFLISDWDAVNQLPGSYAEKVALSVNAGMDMMMVPTRFKEFYQALKQDVTDGKVPVSRIDDAVRRILRVKFAAGLFAKFWTAEVDPKVQAAFGSDDHRAVARECVRQSMVLLKNEHGVLPLSKTAARIHVAGSNADDLGNQCGGWTIYWQGRSGAITKGTTILAAMRAAVSGKASTTYSKDGSGAEGASVGVVVVGERPYAEGAGDRADLALNADDMAAIDRVKQAGIPVVLVIVSGRPLIVTDQVAKVDAVFAAWLPGTEGAGVADVLFGDYKPTGRLSFMWPRSMAQIPRHAGDEPLYAQGFGLSY